jgi:hypothetical protein
MARGGGPVSACPSGKVALTREAAVFDRRRLGLRAYLCPRCGLWHLSSRGKLRQPRVPRLSARECERVWSL